MVGGGVCNSPVSSIMLAPSVVLAEVFVRQRLSVFPDHIGHTEHNLRVCQNRHILIST